MDEQQTWTLVIAVVGLVVAIIAFGWNVYLHTLNRPKILFTASIMRIHPTSPGLAEDAEVLIVEAVNLRSRPVTIQGFYAKFSKSEVGKSHCLMRSPKELAGYTSAIPLQIGEGEVARIMTLVDRIDDINNFAFFYARDTTGRLWHSKKHPLRRQLERRELGSV